MQLRQRVPISPFGVGFERRVLVHDRAALEVVRSVDGKRADQDDPADLRGILHRIEQIARGNHGVEIHLCGRAAHSCSGVDDDVDASEDASRIAACEQIRRDDADATIGRQGRSQCVRILRRADLCNDLVSGSLQERADDGAAEKAARARHEDSHGRTASRPTGTFCESPSLTRSMIVVTRNISSYAMGGAVP